MTNETPRVVAVARDGRHRFSKGCVEAIRAVAWQGIEGDAHFGSRVKHRSRVRQDPTQPNLRQVHLIGKELLDEVNGKGFSVKAGELGENILTVGLDLLALPEGTLLEIGDQARLKVTGLRNPCSQIETFRPGLLAEVLHRSGEGRLLRRAGIMAVVLTGGPIRPGDPIMVRLPPLPHKVLDRV